MPARFLLRCASVLALLAGGALPATAQPGPSSASSPSLPRVELGGQLTAVTYLPGEAFNFVRAGGLTFDVPLTHRHAAGLALLAFDVDAGDVNGLYHASYRYTFGEPAAATRPFVTAGFAGGFAYHEYPEHRLLRADRSEVVYPGYRHASVGEPQAIAFGGGVRHRVKRVAFVLQGTSLCGGGGCLVLTSIGASFGIGGRR